MVAISKEYNTEDEEEMRHIISSHKLSLKKVEDQVYDVLVWHSNLIFMLKISELRDKLAGNLEDHGEKESELTSTMLGIETVPEEVLRKFTLHEHIKITPLRETIKKAL